VHSTAAQRTAAAMLMSVLLHIQINLNMQQVLKKAGYEYDKFEYNEYKGNF
jgi:hypothetical protein